MGIPDDLEEIRKRSEREKAKFSRGSQFGILYGYLDTMRSIGRDASAKTGQCMEQKHVDQIDRINDLVNSLIGQVLDASKLAATNE